MNNIRLLDCTLRDGGYVNDCRFGYDNIVYTIDMLEKAGIDIIDLGFLRNEKEDKDRTVFRSTGHLEGIIRRKKKNVTYAVLAEVFNPIEANQIVPSSESLIDVIRVMIWKDMHDEHGKIVDALKAGYDYCKLFADKGYKLYIQPARVEQYSDDEFVGMLRMYDELNPDAVYIVDSWGTMYADQVLHYMSLADKHLNKEVSLGFHGHNNMMQAFSNAVSAIEFDTNRDVYIDGSVYGIGRGAGNLHTEIIAKYLNEHNDKGYGVLDLLNIYEKHIRDIRLEHVWGFTPGYFITALNHANPGYASYYEGVCGMDSKEIDYVLGLMTKDEMIMYSKESAKRILSRR